MKQHILSPNKEKLMLLGGIVGIGFLVLSMVAYMQLFSYQVITKSGENNVTITYVNPLDALFPIFLVAGLSLSGYGFLQSTPLLVSNKRRVALVLGFGGVLMTLSLLNVTYVPAIIGAGCSKAYDYGFPLIWLEHCITSPNVPDGWWQLSVISPLIFLFWSAVSCVSLSLVWKVLQILAGRLPKDAPCFALL